MATNEILLLPPPRQLERRAGEFALTPPGVLCAIGTPDTLEPFLLRMHTELVHGGHAGWIIAESPAGKSIQLVLDSHGDLPPQGYRLDLAPGSLCLTAPDRAGLHHGLMTLRQLLRQFPAALPACIITDWPDYAVRGIMLDISRDKVPTLATLCTLVDRLAEWKFNHLQLYTEHTFAYRNHREVWEHADPLTPEDVCNLDVFCRERGIELAPNQNSFGHLTRWLKLPRYQPLAESPAGYVTPWGERRTLPMSLDPTNPACLDLLRELFDELLPNFSSRLFNVGCDETWDLGQGRSAAACAARGKGRIYLDFLLKIRDEVIRRGHTMQFWGDIILQHPELVGELPRDLIALNWGYEAAHPFEREAATFSAAGLPFWVCPGTSSWNSLAGRTTNMLGNIRAAAEAGLKHGAEGLLITDWGDNGHWQPLPVSYAGFATTAAYAWNASAAIAMPLAMLLNRHAFLDSAGVMGQLALDLGDLHRLTGVEPANASVLFHLLHKNDLAPWLAKLPAGVLEKTAQRLEEIITPLAHAQMHCPDAKLVSNEFALVAQMLRHGLHRALTGAESADDLHALLAEHRRVWLARNRPGGLDDSQRPLRDRLP
ncbi:MAG: family 20 glycosylhydrolase [Kiritimatiellaeota bacterium]|nr:family 20 glycosylhydrolase [Kiritimatiellota bacterium]